MLKFGTLYRKPTRETREILACWTGCMNVFSNREDLGFSYLEPRKTGLT